MKEEFYQNDNLTRILGELKGYYIAEVDGITNGERNDNFMQGTEINFKKIAANGYIEKKIQIFEDGSVYECPIRVAEIKD